MEKLSKGRAAPQSGRETRTFIGDKVKNIRSNGHSETSPETTGGMHQ